MTPDTGARERLTLEVDPDSCEVHDREMSRVHFYKSSLTHAETREPLISIATRGPGMRMTQAQATELRDWLTAALAAGLGVPPELRTQIEQLWTERARARHRRGSEPDLRQQGEMHAFDLVLRLIEAGVGEARPAEPIVTQIASWLRHSDRLDDIPGAGIPLPNFNPLWDAANEIERRFG